MDKINRTQDVQKVFDQTWKANSYRHNGVMENINNNQQRMNKILGINNSNNLNTNNIEQPKVNTIEQRLTNLQETMAATSNMQNNNNFRK